MKSSLDMGVRALQEGRYHQAIAILEATTQLAPNDPQVWLALARAYKGAGETPKAIAAYQFVLNTRPPDEILALAERELSSLDHRSRATIEEAMRPVCEACGAMLPAARAARPWCLCGWNARTPPVLGRQVYLNDVFAYAAHRGVVVAFRRREDVLLVARNQLRLQALGSRTYPVDPRLALPVRERMAVILQDELRPIQSDAGPDGLVRVRALGQSYGPGKFLSWRQFVAHLSELEGLDVSLRTPDTSLGTVLLAAGQLAPDAVKHLRELRAADESAGQALVRLGLASLDRVVAGAIGEARLGPQPVRAIEDRLGERLVAAGLLDRRRLKQALFLQSQFRRPLGELLVEARLAGPGDVEATLLEQPPPPDALPPADGLGELLIASKLISRTQLMSIEADLARLGGGSLEEFLRERHLVPGDQLDRAVAWRFRKRELCLLGRERLGEILIAQRAISSETLGQALMQQVDSPRPLGLLLAEGGRVSPEQLVAALEEQDRRRNKLAWLVDEEAAIGTRPLEAAGSSAAAFARATTRALSRILVGSDAPPALPGPEGRLDAPAGRRKRRRRSRRRTTPWRLAAAAAAVAVFCLSIAGGLLAGKAARRPPAAPVAAPIAAPHGR